MPAQQAKQDAGRELDERIPCADWRLAVTAAATQEEPAHDGNVVAATNLVPALRATRSRTNDRLVSRHSPYDDVEERPYEQPDDGH